MSKHEELLKEIQSLETNLKYYKRDLNKFFKKIRREYGIEADDIEERLETIGKKIDKITKNREELEDKIENKLRGIKRARRSGRI